MTEKKAKLIKFVDDPCFGKEHEMEEQCDNCWIKKSCSTAFNNRKEEPEPKKKPKKKSSKKK